MAYADPQSVTIASNTVSLPRTSSGTNSGVFTSNDGTAKLSVSHTFAKRNRHQFRLDFSKIAADPLIAGNNVEYSMSAYLVVDEPPVGFTVAEGTDVVKGLVGLLSASSYAAVTKFLGGEN
jgi:hypothetical protein